MYPGTKFVEDTEDGQEACPALRRLLGVPTDALLAALYVVHDLDFPYKDFVSGP